VMGHDKLPVQAMRSNTPCASRANAVLFQA
jgi:hypothetical protein